MNKEYAKAKGNFSNPQAKDVISVYSITFKYAHLYLNNFKKIIFFFVFTVTQSVIKYHSIIQHIFSKMALYVP